MVDNLLRHLAVVVDTSSDPSEAGILGPPLLEQFLQVTESAFEISRGPLLLSLYCPSTEEWFRSGPPSSRAAASLGRGLAALESSCRERGLPFSLLGFIEGLPAAWKEVFSPFLSPTRPDRGVNLFFRYSGREEIAYAMSLCLKEGLGDKTGEVDVSSRLLTAGQPDPDLMVYAGGVLEPRDFLIWQASYAEIWHSPKRGLDFGPRDLKEAVEEYSSRQRRFGRV